MQIQEGRLKDMMEKAIERLRKSFEDRLSHRDAELERRLQSLEAMRIDLSVLQKEHGSVSSQLGALDHKQEKLMEQLSLLEVSVAQAAPPLTASALHAEETKDRAAHVDRVEFVLEEAKRSVRNLSKEVTPKLVGIDQRVEALCVRFDEQLPRLEEKIQANEELMRAALGRTPPMASRFSDISERGQRQHERMLPALSETDVLVPQDSDRTEVRAARDSLQCRIDLVREAIASMSLARTSSSLASTARSISGSVMSARSISRSLSAKVSPSLSRNTSSALSKSGEYKGSDFFSAEHFTLRLELIKRALGTFGNAKKLPTYWFPRMRSIGRRPGAAAQPEAARTVSAFVGKLQEMPPRDPLSPRRSTIC